MSNSTSGNRRSRSEDLNSYFDRSATAVREYADVFEHKYARPALKVGSVYHDQHPIISVFLVILFCLSIVPIITFIGFSIFAAVSFTIIALSLALGVFISVELFFVSILLTVLMAVICMSGFLTGATISTYLFVRLIVLVRNGGRAGLNEWILEIKGRYGSGHDNVARGNEYPSLYDDNHEDTQANENSFSSGSPTEAVTPKDDEKQLPPLQFDPIDQPPQVKEEL